jgi:hypothetical protein
MKPKQIASAGEAADIAVEAYVFGYPLVLMDVTKQVSTAVPKPEGEPLRSTGSLQPLRDRRPRQIEVQRRRLADHQHPARVARQRNGVELAARAGGLIQYVHAAVLAEEGNRRWEWKMPGVERVK